jgi:hypothetical protein
MNSKQQKRQRLLEIRTRARVEERQIRRIKELGTLSRVKRRVVRVR